MIVDQEVLKKIEELKIPYKDKHCPDDWKDWYHYILYDPISKIRILYNLSFNGKPNFGYITDTLVITVPNNNAEYDNTKLENVETFGFARNHTWDNETLKSNPLNFKNETINFKITERNILYLDITDVDLGISMSIVGQALSPPIYSPEPKPFGGNFIGWGVVPIYRVSGELNIGNKLINVNHNWFGYHDRNFGRFNWGNIGWTWFVAHSICEGCKNWTYVLHRSNNNDYTEIGSAILFVYCENQLHKVFYADSITLDIKLTTKVVRPAILPGSMANIFNERNVQRPSEIKIIAKDETDQLKLYFQVDSHFEIIVPDNRSKSYTFMTEISGALKVLQSINSVNIESKQGFFLF